MHAGCGLANRATPCSRAWVIHQSIDRIHLVAHTQGAAKTLYISLIELSPLLLRQLYIHGAALPWSVGVKHMIKLTRKQQSPKII